MQTGSATLLLTVSFSPGRAPKSVRVPAGLTLLEAVETLHLPAQKPFVAVINGKTVDLTYRLQAGDVAHLLPQIAGG